MNPKRGDRAAPPPADGEYDIRFASNDAAGGWEHLARQAPRNLRHAYDAIRSSPRARDNPDRQHRLKGRLGSATFKGQSVEQWQYEVTAAGRIWYLIDDANRTAWVIHAGTGHPKATD
ncbi:conserved hypothetical protein [Frankia canadensis]|uniref:Cytotoxic translational repressor of toxin-antitoxin stability system n=1 Tax=Frankia canadensis TaxID=1836972 RepID=A0A2I2KZB1_9ACTN|nr:hypothetical protein [Frankia canadensis]SNQ50998.1 conserved hypothetical protein [Frankia canadensis]SOU58288.1 conserved hypothetical protein [Frankia canadensis]